MKRMRLFLCMLAFWFVCFETAWGFLPPVDQKSGVKLSIDGVPKTVMLDEGVLFKVVVENESDKALKGTLTVWMNDDWKVSPETAVTFELAVKGRQEFEYKGKASDRALEAWYPVHAKAVVTPSEENAFELHPIALFTTKKTRVQEAEVASAGDGEDQTAWLAQKGVKLDGDLEEWWGQATPVSCDAKYVSAGKITGDSFDGVVMFLHDAENIYVAGQIADDDISCEDTMSDDYMNSDYLRFYFNGVEPAQRKDTSFTDADKVIAVNVFGDFDEKPRFDHNGKQIEDEEGEPIIDKIEKPLMKVPRYVGGDKAVALPPEFKIVARRTGVGYVFEASLPKAVLGAEKAKAIGMNLMIGDADKKVRRSEVYFGRRISNYWLTPSSYFRLELAGPRVARAVEDYSPETITMNRASIRLDHSVSRRVAYRTIGAEAETVMARGFDGSDSTSGLLLQNRLNVNRRNDVRDALAFHPPYKKGVGYVKATYRIQLPEKLETMFSFATALRDHHDGEAPSDGVEYIVEVNDGNKTRRLFRRLSAVKTWEAATIDLRDYMGRTIDLSLIVTPGEKNDTNCDECYWATPQISLKNRYRAETKIEKEDRRAMAIGMAKQAFWKKLDSEKPLGSGRYQLRNPDGTFYGASILPGPEGLVDCFIVFVSEQHMLVYEGFSINIAGVSYGQAHDGEPIVWKGQEMKYGRDIFYHQIETEEYGTVPFEVRVRPYGGTLQFTFTMPGVERDLLGQPRFTKLALGPGNEKPWRIYGGFGNVIEEPKTDFVLTRGGFTLNTRHVGVDYQNGMSLAIGSDFFPDRMVCKPSEKLFTLEAHNDVTFIFAPSSLNAFMAAKEYGRVAGFKASPGLGELLGRQCLDQWSGDYQSAASDARMAAKYGLEHTIFVKHVWQRWGYDYRLPEIYPPMGGVEPFKLLSDACQENGIIFAPHDNYIDFYPDAEGFSYNHIIFNADGTPQKAWYNKGREAQSYRWLPHAFKPWLVKNMELIRDNIGAHGLFIDVFSAIPPMDYYDRDGRFYDSKRTAKEWSDAFDTCREILWKDKGPMLSECGHDGLIGSLDGGQADHFSGNRWGAEVGKWERVPWHDIVSHGKFVLLGGGLGSRYAEKDPAQSGYGSDNYNGTTVIGGRNPMSDGPFSIAAVKTYWMLHDVCDWLAHRKFTSFEFDIRNPKPGEIMKIRKDNKHLFTSIHHLHAVFGEDNEKAEIWCNREADNWELPGELVMRPDEIEAYVDPTLAEAMEDNGEENEEAEKAEPEEKAAAAENAEEKDKAETEAKAAPEEKAEAEENTAQAEGKTVDDKTAAGEKTVADVKEEEKKAETKKKEKKLPKWILPEFGYYVKTPEITAYVVKKNDKTVGFCRKDGCVFYDARPDYTSILSKQNITATVNSLKKVSEFVFEMEVTWNFEVGAKVEKASQFIHVTHPSSQQGESILYYGTVEKTNLDHRKAGVYHSTIKVALPKDAPDGEHKILFGIFDPQTGGRLGITSLRMEGSRVYGGSIEVKRDEDGNVTTTVTKAVTNDNNDTLEAPMVDFDGVKTNGSFRWVRLSERRWRLIPVPGSLPFRMEGSQKALAGLNDAKIVSVMMVNPWNRMAQKPKTVYSDGVLNMEIDGRSFAYDVEFK